MSFLIQNNLSFLSVNPFIFFGVKRRNFGWFLMLGPIAISGSASQLPHSEITSSYFALLYFRLHYFDRV